MSICELCEREMLDDGVSCIVTPVPTGTGAFHPIAFGSERVRGWKAESCGDCGVRPGGFHHRGCDMEECPRCRGQLISCGCDVSESPYDDLFDDEDPIERFPDLLPRRRNTSAYGRSSIKCGSPRRWALNVSGSSNTTS